MSDAMKGFKVQVSRKEMLEHVRARAEKHRASAAEIEALEAEVREKKPGEMSRDYVRSVLDRAGASGTRFIPGMHAENQQGALLAVLRFRRERERASAEEFAFYEGHLPDVQGFVIDPREMVLLEFVATPDGDRLFYPADPSSTASYEACA